LRRDAKTAEEAYLLFKKKHEEARISSAMDRQELVNVSIAQPAERPIAPVGISRLLQLLVAILLIALGGVGLVFGLEFFDHSFTSPADLERRLGIPHLASIPEDVGQQRVLEQGSGGI
jgi:capsular polysaccharide biosynthesis protein